MLQLLKIEWFKIKAYPAFWWLMGITAIAYPGISYSMLGAYRQLSDNKEMPGIAAKMLLGNPFTYGEVWHTIAYFSSIFVFFPAIIVIMLITNEYNFKTHRQNIIDGWNRKQFLTAKLLDVGIIAVLITILYIGVCLLVGMNNTDAADTSGDNKIYFIGYFLVQTFSQLSIAFLIGFLVRKSFIALSLFIFSFLILEPALTWTLSAKKMPIGHFLPFEISDRMIPPPAFFAKMNPEAYQLSMNNTGNHFAYTLIFTVILWACCYTLNARRDL